LPDSIYTDDIAHGRIHISAVNRELYPSPDDTVLRDLTTSVRVWARRLTCWQRNRAQRGAYEYTVCAVVTGERPGRLGLPCPSPIIEWASGTR
jgi:hypothetical protein